jgi:hypothetical protein
MKAVDLLKSKTVWGGWLIIAAQLLAKPVIEPLDWLRAVGEAILVAGARHAVGKLNGAAVKSLVVGLVAMSFLASGVSAQTKAGGKPGDVTGGVQWFPYAGLAVTRASEDWSPGVVLAVEVLAAPVWIMGGLHLHDVWNDGEDVFPWDQTVEFAGGAAWGGQSFLDVAITPYAGLTLDRPSAPADWSIGTVLGAEIDFEPIYLDLSYRQRDILSESEVYPWDGEFRLAVGGFLSGDD